MTPNADNRRRPSRRSQRWAISGVQVREPVPHFFGYWWRSARRHTRRAHACSYLAGTVSVVCPFRQDAAGTHGERQRRSKSVPPTAVASAREGEGEDVVRVRRALC
jgi:hypothetical protein